MKYIGKLYGKLGGKYFDTGKTSNDFDMTNEENLNTFIKFINEHCYMNGGKVMLYGNAMSPVDYFIKLHKQIR